MDWAAVPAWLVNPWLVWGVGPYIMSVLGFLVPTLLLEALLARGWLEGSQLTYASSSNRPRQELLQATHARVSFSKQVKGCLKFILGIPTISTCVGSAVAMQLLGRSLPTAWWPASLAQALAQFLAAAVLNDFLLYLGHRVQHEVPFLWQFHAKHHSIDTPSPWSTLFIHPVDATLQGSLPLLVVTILLEPAPAVMYLFLAARLGENVLNHSGLDQTLINTLTLKNLPFRASVGHHDAHHKYSNHLGNAKNYAEGFWIWDAMFGTCSPLTGVAAGSTQSGKKAL